ncbi:MULTISPECIES: ExeA family protein [unclassified Massilia]|uniref:ExeA family protein n=1 Tax=unclassified Massilia TaxID=2609279 RepID=UPI00178642E6|nr:MULTISPECIES: AAA family ATPase [unclassified Massilia]MBD8531961.1 AAA family ATPase [Massilia sp. CFBP 13647]MBD8675425.1 AAA family ATPase [Massilia sp. CFBP 13721]
MYTNYFNLKQAPFSIAPDPRYLFMSERHREALAHLLYGINSGGGFVLLTGEIGAGKTTVCRCFIEQVPDNCRLAYIFNPKLTVGELLQSVCEEFRIAAPGGEGGVKGYVDAINAYLLESHAQGRNNVLVIDEAQNLAPDVLEQLRLLTNLETSERKLLQIILIGQPELRTMLARPELEQLAQRVIARYHLGPLSEPETGAYIAHRMAVAGSQGAPVFPAAVVAQVHRLTGGVPRRINLLCDRALLGAYVENSREVTRTILARAAEEVFAGDAAAPARPARWPLVAGALLAGAALSAAAAWQVLPHRAAPVEAPVVAAKGTIAPAAAPATALPRAHADEASALRALGTLWGAALPAGEPCQVAFRFDLRCHAGRGGIYELRQLDRPAVITLREGRSTSYAVLVGMDERSVTLLGSGKDAGKRERVELAALVPRFTGEYTTFWKMPRAFRDHLAPGDQGADVDWLAARLAQLVRAAAPPAQQPFNARTQDLLRSFQAKQNLKADGVAGPRTYMRLNQLSGVAEPRLLAATGTGH